MLFGTSGPASLAPSAPGATPEDACLCWVTQAADVVLHCCPAVLDGAKAGRVPAEGLSNAFGMFLQNELSFGGTASLDSSWEEERRAQAACKLLTCLPEWLCCPAQTAC